MAFCQVTYSVNAGISLRLGNTHILVDVCPDQRVVGFSCLSSTLWDTVQKASAFQNPDIICFTHCHPDHYSYEKAAQLHRCWPNATLILPEKCFSNQMVLQGDTMEYRFRDLHFRFIKLPHAGEAYSNVPHYGMLITYEGNHIFLPGDGEIACPEIVAAAEGINMDIAVLNFPWITLRRGRKFLLESLHPRHLIVYHLPLASEDIYGFNKAVDYSARFVSAATDMRILRHPLQTEIILFMDK